jgi:hypothetical protein
MANGSRGALQAFQDDEGAQACQASVRIFPALGVSLGCAARSGHIGLLQIADLIGDRWHGFWELASTR